MGMFPKILNEGLSWLQKINYKVPQNIVDLLCKYLNAEADDIFRTIEINENHNDAIAHMIHEIVEVTEAYKKYGEIYNVKLHQEVYRYAHLIALWYEEQYLTDTDAFSPRMKELKLLNSLIRAS